MTDARSVTGTVQSTENNEKETVVVVGKESVGKSELVAGLAGMTFSSMRRTSSTRT